MPTNPSGIPISYACPRYGSYTVGDVTVTAGSDQYAAGVSTSPAVGADGRLAAAFKTVSGPFGDPGTCQSAFGSSSDVQDVRPQQVPGTYYWQVWRYCADCAGQYEVGPVRSFTVVLGTKLTLRKPGAVYTGIPRLFTVQVQGDLGETVELQRKKGSRWATVGRSGAGRQGDVAADEVALIAKLPAGSQQVRARVTSGGAEVTSAVRTVKVKKPKGWSRASVGSYRDPKRESLRFSITDGGRSLRGFTTQVTATCTDLNGQTSVVSRLLTLPRAKVGPDGSFVVALDKKGQRGWLQGRWKRGKVAGYASYQGGGCGGDLRFKARKR